MRRCARFGCVVTILLAAGALFSVIALPLSLLLDTIGGLLAGIGGALVLIGVIFGYQAD